MSQFESQEAQDEVAVSLSFLIWISRNQSTPSRDDDPINWVTSQQKCPCLGSLTSSASRSSQYVLEEQNASLKENIINKSARAKSNRRSQLKTSAWLQDRDERSKWIWLVNRSRPVQIWNRQNPQIAESRTSYLNLAWKKILKSREWRAEKEQKWEIH